MTMSKFTMEGSSFEQSTNGVIQPHHIHLVPGAEYAVVNPLPQPPPGAPAQDRHEQAPDTTEVSRQAVLMALADGTLKTFQEFEVYYYDVQSDSDCDAPEDNSEDLDPPIEESNKALMDQLLNPVTSGLICAFTTPASMTHVLVESLKFESALELPSSYVVCTSECPPKKLPNES